jgi:hypothetical protein
MDKYYAVKQDGDIDMLAAVRNIMLQNGLQGKIEAYFNNNNYIREAEGKTSDVQRFLLNRYWAYQLAYFPEKSMDQRYCLVPNGTPQDWLKLFESMIMPFIIDHDLPRA